MPKVTFDKVVPISPGNVHVPTLFSDRFSTEQLTEDYWVSQDAYIYKFECEGTSENLCCKPAYLEATQGKEGRRAGWIGTFEESDARLIGAESNLNGFCIGQRIYWEDAVWTKLETSRLTTPLDEGSRVLVLDNGVWIDGCVSSMSSTTKDMEFSVYDIIVYGYTASHEIVLYKIPAHFVMPFVVGNADRVLLVKDVLMFFADVGSDIASQIIFLSNGDYKYAIMNTLGIMMGNILRIMALYHEGRPNLCMSFLQSLFGLDVLFEFAEVWKRGYRTQRWTHTKFFESAVERMVSMGVQVYAFIYEDKLQTIELIVIGGSIFMSILGVATNVGVEFIELQCRGLTSPEDRRQLLSEYSYEVRMVAAVRFLEARHVLLLRISSFWCYSIHRF